MNTPPWFLNWQMVHSILPGEINKNEKNIFILGKLTSIRNIRDTLSRIICQLNHPGTLMSAAMQNLHRFFSRVLKPDRLHVERAFHKGNLDFFHINKCTSFETWCIYKHRIIKPKKNQGNILEQSIASYCLYTCTCNPLNLGISSAFYRFDIRPIWF